MIGAYRSAFNISGAYFTGLSLQTTLQLNLKAIIEVCPGPTDAIATLATASPEYDPAALEFYSRICSRLPPGVPQDENPAGEFFKQVLSTVGDIAQMGSVIHPAFGLIGGGAKAIARLIPQRAVTPMV